MTDSVDKLAGQKEMCTSDAVSAAPRDNTGGKTPENIDVLRDVFWESALESSSILAWIVAYMGKAKCPFLEQGHCWRQGGEKSSAAPLDGAGTASRYSGENCKCHLCL